MSYNLLAKSINQGGKKYWLTSSVCEHCAIIMSHDKFVTPFCFNHVKRLHSLNPGVNES